MKTADETPAQFPETAAHRIVALLAQHRLATSGQLQVLLGGNRRYRSRLLTALRTDGIVDYTVLGTQKQTRAWFLTTRGARVAAAFPELEGRTIRAPLDPTEASLRSAHTLTVTRSHVAFLTDARARGHDYGPLDWLPEVAHRLPDSQGEDRLIADALLFYSVPAAAGEPRRSYRAFVEVDRGTMSSERLARKLIAYARFHSYRPLPPGRRSSADIGADLAWQRFYPLFPRLLFILTNTTPSGLRQRAEDLRAMAAGHPLVTAFAAEVPLGVAVLEDLEALDGGGGPMGAVWTPLSGDPAPRSWVEL